MEFEKLTFTPLSRGRFRCNQKKTITKNCKKFRRMHSYQKSQLLPQIKKAVINQGRWWCPYCHQMNYSPGLTRGTKKCRRCYETVLIRLS